MIDTIITEITDDNRDKLYEWLHKNHPEVKWSNGSSMVRSDNYDVKEMRTRDNQTWKTGIDGWYVAEGGYGDYTFITADRLMGSSYMTVGQDEDYPVLDQGDE